MDEYHGSHIREEMLERYALNQLIEAQLGPLEEHLLICFACQKSLDAMDEYVQAMKLVLAEADSPAWRPERPWAWHTPRVSVMWAVTVTALVIVLALPARRNHNPPSEVALVAPRGGDSLPVAHGRAGAGLVLHIDLREVAKAGRYRLEVVDSGGQPVWHASIQPDHDQLVVRLSALLKPGAYWVRLFDTSQPPVAMREYGLELR